jgi:hypothetical protein
MPTELDKVCLGCTLLECDDRSAECKFVQITRQVRPARPDRSEYWRKYYQDNREAIKKKTGAYQKEKKTWRKKDRRQYFKDRYRRKCDEARMNGQL